MAVGDLYQVILNSSTTNRSYSNSLWYREKTNSNVTEAAQLVADAWFSQIAAAFRDVMANDSELESIRVFGRRPAKVIPGGHLLVTGAGTRSGETMPNSNALVLSLEQETFNARNNGKMFIGGISELDVEENTFTNGFVQGPVATLETQLGLVLQDQTPGPGEWELVVMSRTAGAPNPPLGNPALVTARACKNIVYTQRRRRTTVKGCKG